VGAVADSRRTGHGDVRAPRQSHDRGCWFQYSGSVDLF
jgi:hypothetical protein